MSPPGPQRYEAASDCPQTWLFTGGPFCPLSADERSSGCCIVTREAEQGALIRSMPFGESCPVRSQLTLRLGGP